MLRARDAMDRSYAQPLDIPTLARVACVSEVHFIRTFRATFGETPHRYLQRRRVGRATFLLRQTDLADLCPRPERGSRLLRREAWSRGEFRPGPWLHALADRQPPGRSWPPGLAGDAGPAGLGRGHRAAGARARDERRDGRLALL